MHIKHERAHIGSPPLECAFQNVALTEIGVKLTPKPVRLFDVAKIDATNYEVFGPAMIGAKRDKFTHVSSLLSGTGSYRAKRLRTG